MSDQADGGARLAALRAELDGLRRAFQRYFDGRERTVPLAARDAFERALRRASSEVRGSAQSFQLQSLRASWSVHAAHIDRVLAQVEAGTYPAHRARAEAVRTGAQPGSDPHLAKAPVSVTPAAAPLAAPSPGGAPEPAPVLPVVDAASEPDLPGLRAAWADAAAHGKTPVPSREAFAAVVHHKIAEARARTGHRHVEVRVVVERGVPTLQVTTRA